MINVIVAVAITVVRGRWATPQTPPFLFQSLPLPLGFFRREELAPGRWAGPQSSLARTCSGTSHCAGFAPEQTPSCLPPASADLLITWSLLFLKQSCL